MDPTELIQQPKLPGVLQYSTPEAQAGPYRARGMLWINPVFLIFEREGASSLQLLHTEIDTVELRPQPAQGTMMTLRLKTFRQLHFWIPVDSHAKNAAHTIQHLSCPGKYIWLPMYQPMPSDKNLEGWDLFDVAKEYKRMGVGAKQRGKDTWRITSINDGMKVCSTYPSQLVVPADVEDEVLEQVARHRTHRRFPVAVYLDTTSPGVLVRCSQPRIGPRNKTCYPDTQLFRKIKQACGGGTGGVILDTRSSSAAQAHRSKGGGFEPVGTGSPYSGWKQHFCDMLSCKQLQTSFARFLDACQDPTLDMSSFWSKIETSGWISQVRTALFAAVAAAKSIRDNGDPVVIHGETGWDNTCVLSALTQLLLDPHFRTIDGFAELVEKEWLSMGHPFSLRHAHFGNPSQPERGPFFLLFLDCVHQCLHQYPFCFEFTDALLIDLHKHSQVADFGTFMLNNLLERQMLRDTKQAQSLWPHLLKEPTRRKYVNPAYAPTCQTPPLWLRLSYRAQAVHVWSEMYCWRDMEATPPQAQQRQAMVVAGVQAASVQDELALVLEEIAALEAQRTDGPGAGQKRAGVATKTSAKQHHRQERVEEEEQQQQHDGGGGSATRGQASAEEATVRGQGDGAQAGEVEAEADRADVRGEEEAGMKQPEEAGMKQPEEAGMKQPEEAENADGTVSSETASRNDNEDDAGLELQGDEDCVEVEAEADDDGDPLNVL